MTKDKRVKEILMKISTLIAELKETDIYSIEAEQRCDLTGPLGALDIVIDFLISRMEKW